MPRVFQSYALYPHLKVIDNIAFPLKQKGISKEERHQKAREMAEKINVFDEETKVNLIL